MSCLASSGDTKSNTVLQTLRRLFIFNNHIPRQLPVIVFPVHTNTTCIYGHANCPGHYRWQPPSAWTNNQLQQFVFVPNAAPVRLHQTPDSPSIAPHSFSQTQRPSTIVPTAQPIQPPPISTPANVQQAQQPTIVAVTQPIQPPPTSSPASVQQPTIAPVGSQVPQALPSIVNSDSQQAQDAPVVPATAPQQQQRRRRSTSIPTPATNLQRTQAPAPSASQRNDSPVSVPPTTPSGQSQPTPQTNNSVPSNDMSGNKSTRPCKWCIRYHTTCDYATPMCGPCVARRDLVECVYSVGRCALCRRSNLFCDRQQPCKTCLVRKNKVDTHGCIYGGVFNPRGVGIRE